LLMYGDHMVKQFIQLREQPVHSHKSIANLGN
jgi:hypothetical protein